MTQPTYAPNQTFLDMRGKSQAEADAAWETFMQQQRKWADDLNEACRLSPNAPRSTWSGGWKWVGP